MTKLTRPKVFCDLHYSTDDNGVELILNHHANEMRLEICSSSIELGSCDIQDLQDWIDLFTQARDDKDAADLWHTQELLAENKLKKDKDARKTVEDTLNSLKAMGEMKEFGK